MALFSLSIVIFTVSHAVSLAAAATVMTKSMTIITKASSSRSSYGTITTQPTYQPHPSPSYARDSYAHIDSSI